MDQVFLELVGKPKLNPPKIITVVAENFSLIDHQARFFRATLALPHVKQLPFDDQSKVLIQLGPHHNEIYKFVLEGHWTVLKYDTMSDEDLCEKIYDDINLLKNRSIIFINSVSRLELCQANKSQLIKIPVLIDKLKRLKGHFVVALFQGPALPTRQELSCLKPLEYISDATIRVEFCKAGFYKKIHWLPIESKTLIPNKIQTSYFTCKVGKFYWADMLCFCDRKQVSHTYDPITNTERISINDSEDDGDDVGDDNEQVGVKHPNLNAKDLHQQKQTVTDKSLVTGSSLDDDDSDIVLPYTRAQNPEQSRIFYYPDKEDDIDEDDPDNDLGI